HLLEAMPDVAQVLILGAGYDSRAYRFATSIAGRAVFEVDLAPLSRVKRQIVADHPELFTQGRVTSVEIDFRTQLLADRLRDSGFVTGAATFVAWEGVSMYLTHDAVTATLDALAQVCGAGSILAMDFFQAVRGVGPYDQFRRLGARSLGLIGEPITFRTPSTTAATLLSGAGFDVIDLATADRMTSRYATGGRSCDEGMYVAAARLR
ncbi:MAG: SAM-dependent methyltransferase, partial [Jatrophihabitans sp.]